MNIQYDLMRDFSSLLRIRNATDNKVKREVYNSRLRELKATMDYFNHHAWSDDEYPDHSSIKPTFILR